MPDPILTPGNCIGSTCSVTLGFDETSLTPNQLLAILNKDERTIECADGIGTRVKICGENAEIPFAARTLDPNSGNALRVQEGDVGQPDCGLVVLAPNYLAIPNAARVALAQNATLDDDPIPVDGPDIQTIVLANPDSIDRVFTVKGRYSIITEIGAADNGAEGQFIFRSALEAFGGGAPGIAYVGAGVLNSRVVTMTYPPGDFDGRTLNVQHDFIDEVIIPGGQTKQIRYYTSTIRTMNMITAGSNGPPPPGTPFRGVNMVGVSVRSEQARTA